jgi:hypothetical protein
VSPISAGAMWRLIDANARLARGGTARMLIRPKCGQVATAHCLSDVVIADNVQQPNQPSGSG